MLRVAEIIYPTTRVVAAEDVALISLDKHNRRTFVVAIFVKALRDVQS